MLNYEHWGMAETLGGGAHAAARAAMYARTAEQVSTEYPGRFAQTEIHLLGTF